MNSWAESDVFQKQLDLNLRQLGGPYPEHWAYLVDQLPIGGPFKLLDVGCGCGAISALCARHAPEIKYTGVDISEKAIALARSQWPNAEFIQMDFQALTAKFVYKFDIVLANALHNVLEDGDAGLKFMLDLRPKMLILLRMLISEGISRRETYKAYNQCDSYKFWHARESLYAMMGAEYTYEESRNGDSSHFILRRKGV